MNNKTPVTFVTAMAFILMLCVVVPVSENTEAVAYDNIGDPQAFEDAIGKITDAIESQPDSTTNTTYDINITSDIELSSLDLDFSGDRTEAKKYTVRLNIGTEEDPKTLTLSGTGAESGITIASNGLDNITITIRYGNIVDNRISETSLSTIAVQGPEHGNGATSVTLLNTSVSSAVPANLESGSILSVMGGASVTLNGAVLKTTGNDKTVGVSMESNTGSKTTTLKTYSDSLIESSAQGILAGNGETSITISGNTQVSSSGSNAIQQDKGTLSISNANVILVGADYAISKNSGNLTISGGLFKGTTGAINNTGTDKISTKLSGSGGVFSSDITEACTITSTYSIVQVGDRFYGSFEGENPVASIGEAKYSNFSYVNAALHASDAEFFEVTLLSNTSSSAFTPYDDVILNLNNYNLSLSSNNSLEVDGFSVEITGTGKLSLSTLSILGSDDSKAENYSTLNIGQNVTVSVTNAIIIGEADSPHGYGVVVDVDGKIDASTTQGITVNGTLKDTIGNTPVINVNGEIVAAENDRGIYAAGYATWNIRGKVSGGTGIELRAGNVNVYEGAVISSTAEAFTEEKNSEGPTMIGAGIAVSQHTTNLPISLNIEGGEISGPYALYEKDLQDSAGTDDINMEVTGGKFTGTNASVSSANVQDFISGGSFLKQKEDGSTEADSSIGDFIDSVHSIDPETGEVAVDESKVVVTNGSNSYATFDEAIRAAQDGDTIVLAVSGDTYTMTESLTPRNGNHMTIDLGGKILDFGTTYRILATSGSGGLTFENGTLEFEHDSPIQVLGCDLRFENCTIETSGIFPSSGYQFGPSIFAMFGYADADTTKRSSLYVGPDCEVVYNDNAEIGAYVVNVFDNNQKAAYGVTVDFQGRMTGNIGLAFYINGTVNKTEGNVPQIHVAMPDDSKVSGGFYAAGYANWDIDSGYFEGSTTLSIKSGTFDISGGTFHAIGEYRNPADANSNGSEETGAALSITSNDDYAGNVKVTVTGGTFTSENGHAVYEGIATESSGSPAASSSDVVIDIQDGTFRGNAEKGDVAITEAENTKVISGGSFSSNITDFCVDGFKPTQDKDGNYVVDVDDEALDIQMESILGFVSGETESYFKIMAVSNLTIVWSSSDASVATVAQDGTVTFIAGGEARITATVILGNGQTLTDAVDITVFEVPVVEGLVFETFTDVDLDNVNDIIDANPSIIPDEWIETTDPAVISLESETATFSVPYEVFANYGWPVTAENYTDYEFMAVHFPDEGGYEVLDVKASAEGLTVTSNGFSPFVFLYKEATGGSDDTELPPFNPYPGDDDDYVPLPPTIVYEDDGSDSTASIAACAAAAVVAAILAIVLASTYRRK